MKDASHEIQDQMQLIDEILPPASTYYLHQSQWDLWVLTFGKEWVEKHCRLVGDFGKVEPK